MTMDTDLESRRAEFARLLKNGSCAKLQICETSEALASLTRAYELANQEPRLPKPWPQLAAYRYAHLLLRSNPETANDLYEIDQLFAKAAQAKSLTVFPSLYRLAVLDKFRRLSPPVVDQEMILKRFRACRESVAEYLSHGRTADDPFPIQHGVANMLELAAYFLNVPFREWEGIRDEESDPAQHWHLVGPEPSIAHIRFAGEFILEELQARREANPQALIFCLPQEGNPWWQAPAHSEKRLRENTARLLDVLLMFRNPSPEQIRNRVFRSYTSSDTMRQARRRFRADLAQITGRPESDFGGATEGDISLPRDLVIFGAVADCRLPSTDD